MAEWEKKVGGINLFVEDLDQVKRFYQDIFGMAPVHEDSDVAMFRLKNLMIFLNDAAGAGKLIAPAQPGPPGAGPRAEYVIIVDDIDAVCAEIQQKGVVLVNGPQDRPWGMRTAAFSDPAGNFWELAQEIPG
jgi:predicted enzyme related to lactoylglutathione lyase